jgi:opacity protein-like surface antigen
MKRILAIIAIVAAISSGGVSAQEKAREDGPYIRIGAGATFVSDWEQDITLNPNPSPISGFNVPADGKILDFSEGLTLAAAVGFDYADGIRTELEYRYAQTDVELFTGIGGFSENFGGPVPPFDPDVGINAHFIMSNFFFDFYNQSPITPFIGGGVGGALVRNELGTRDAALAYQGRAGISLSLGGGFLADVEYIYLRTSKLVYGPADEDFPLSGLGLRVDGDRYESSSVMMSLRKPF